MKKALFAPLLAFVVLPACSDVEPLGFDPRDASQVEGLWYQYPNKNWVWHFDGLSSGTHDSGLLTQSIFDYNAEIWKNKAAYWTRGDTLRFQDLDGGSVKTFLVEFQGADTFKTKGLPIGITNIFIRF